MASKVGILNIGGYAGLELARILLRHPEVELASVTGRSLAGTLLGDAFPHLASSALRITEELDSAVDFAFSALPHGASAPAVAPLVRRGVPVVDLSADFRLKDSNVYEEWYQTKHPATELLAEAVYGLPELHRDAVAGSRLVAGPGCYPTGAILALAPAVKAGVIQPDIVIDSKSGVSGAGRGLSLTSHFGELNDNVHAYSVRGHRHQPEMSQELGLLSDLKPAITFLPHLIPMTRGILSSCYAKLADGFSGGQAEIDRLYESAFESEPFVTVVSEPPQTKQTTGTNNCLVHPVVNERTGRLIVISCIDNLGKGAAGQAVQSMNLMLGFPETAGLDAVALYP